MNKIEAKIHDHKIEIKYFATSQLAFPSKNVFQSTVHYSLLLFLFLLFLLLLLELLFSEKTSVQTNNKYIHRNIRVKERDAGSIKEGQRIYLLCLGGRLVLSEMASK